MPVPETYASKVTKTDFQNVAVEVNLKLGRAGGETITAAAATTKGLILKGAVSQTANLAEFQDSAGTVLAGVDAAGKGIGGLAGSRVEAKVTAATGTSESVTWSQAFALAPVVVATPLLSTPDVGYASQVLSRSTTGASIGRTAEAGAVTTSARMVMAMEAN